MFSPSCGSTRMMTGPAAATQFLVLSVPAPGMTALFPLTAGDAARDLDHPLLDQSLIVDRRESGRRHRGRRRREVVDRARARRSLPGVSHEARWRGGVDHQSKTIARRLPGPARD